MLHFIYILLALSSVLIFLLAAYAYKRLGRGWSVKLLFKDFKRKIWMTVSLGFLFLGIYLLAVALSVHFVHEWKTDLFFLVYQNPVPFIYGGLWLFAFFSLSIYLARMVVKYFYLTRGKDS